MKKILIVSHALELGGAERSLIGLLEAMQSSDYQIDLFLLRHAGEMLPDVPKNVNLLPEIPAYTVLARPMKDVLKEGHILLTFARMFGKISACVYEKKHHFKDSGVALEYSHKYTCPFMPLIQPDTEYDLAISFLTPHYFVAKKVRAKKKVAWIHTDYSNVQIHVQSELKMWDAFNRIISISDDVTNHFVQVFPTLQDKIVKMENILPEQSIARKANIDGAVELRNKEGIKLLSIGRYCVAKNFDNIPNICSRLVQRGYDVTWYMIGFGGDEPLIRQRIIEEHMEERVILLGKKENPYPYIKACDFYIQPSRYEGKCVAVREAQMLGKPVIITDYPTASSQLMDGYDGVIVPMDNEGCAEGIAKVLRDKELQNKLIENMRKTDYTNAEEVQKLYGMMR